MQRRSECVEAKPEGKTDWGRLHKMTDADIEQAVANDPDAAPVLSDEKMRREYKAVPAICA